MGWRGLPFGWDRLARAEPGSGGRAGRVVVGVVVCVGDGRLALAAPARQQVPVQPRPSQPPGLHQPQPMPARPMRTTAQAGPARASPRVANRSHTSPVPARANTSPRQPHPVA